MSLPPAVAIPLAIIGTGLQAIGAIQQGQAASDAAKFNQRVFEQNAVAARQRAAAEAEDSRRRTARLLGRQRAGIGARGLAVEGSPLELLSDTAAEGELEARRIIDAGELEARGFTQRAALARAEASSARREGIFGAFGAASNLLFLGPFLSGGGSPTETLGRRGPGAGPPIRGPRLSP